LRWERYISRTAGVNRNLCATFLHGGNLCPVPEISMPFAAGQLAVFQSGSSRTGGGDDRI